MDRPDQQHGGASTDGDRRVAFDDEPPVLPDQTRDDTDLGWGERHESNDARLIDDRPPHWG
jgi:hypothetical protein